MSIVVTIDEANFDAEYALSSAAIRDFLYIYFEISGDCLPIGDWDRAELGMVDPFRFLDIEYSYQNQFRSPAELQFIREGAAVNLLCRLAQVIDYDEGSDSSLMPDFNSPETRKRKEIIFRQHAPDLFRVHEAFCHHRIVNVECIQQAFVVAFSNRSEEFWKALRRVRETVIAPTFALGGE